MLARTLCVFAFAAAAAALPTRDASHPLLTEDTLSLEAQEVFAEIQSSGIAQIVQFPEQEGMYDLEFNETSGFLPVVQMHGMGDFAANPMGMVPMRKAISERMDGTYVVNIPLGNNVVSDMLGSFVEIMDREVEIFAEHVQKDAKLAGGFNAIGYSQGGLIIRGYIEKYNSPPVHNFVSVHGPLMGVSGFPQCNMTSSICRLFDTYLGDAAYLSLSQHVLAQANYFRDPMRAEEYLAKNIFLPELNNEKEPVNANYTSNLRSLNKMVCVKALGDTMVWPNESEWWGHFADGSNTEVLAMQDTKTYQSDVLGLRELVEGGRYVNLTTPGNHLQFSQDFLMGLVDDYFKQ